MIRLSWWSMGKLNKRVFLNANYLNNMFCFD